MALRVDQRHSSSADIQAQWDQLISDLGRHGQRIQDSLSKQVRSDQKFSLGNLQRLFDMRGKEGQRLSDSLSNQFAELRTRAEEAKADPSLANREVKLSEAQRQELAKTLKENPLNQTSLRMAWGMLNPRSRGTILQQAIREIPQSSGAYIQPKPYQPPKPHGKSDVDHKEAYRQLTKGEHHPKKPTETGEPKQNPSQRGLAETAKERGAEARAGEGPSRPLAKGKETQEPAPRFRSFGTSEPPEHVKARELMQAGALRFVLASTSSLFPVPQNPVGLQIGKLVSNLLKERAEERKEAPSKLSRSDGKGKSTEELFVLRMRHSRNTESAV